MISVEEAHRLIIENARPMASERVPVDDSAGRRASAPVIAQITNLPYRASAMDGYAVRFSDMAPGAKLKVIGEAPAGAPFDGEIGEGEAVRIFTGGIAPDSADHVIIQEDVTREGDVITVTDAQSAPGNIRAAGQDFQKGDTIIAQGAEVSPLAAALIASANIAEIEVAKRPKVYFFSNGDELVAPGAAALAKGQVVSSTPYGFTSLVRSFGADAIYGGVAIDTIDSLNAMIDAALEAGANIITPLGGASVGDYDLVKPAFYKRGFESIFEKIAVRPGKPTWFAKHNRTLALGLPGNPASAFACAYLFLAPLIRTMTGAASPKPTLMKARLASPLRANGPREHYLRATMYVDDAGIVRAEAFANQDSSLLAPFAGAGCLIRREPKAPAAEADALVEILPL